jgi:transporter family-2 protein
MQIIYVILAILCGAIYPIQGSVNGKLINYVGHPIITAIISFFVGLTSLIVIGFLGKVPWHQAIAAKNAPWYAWTGGLFGAFYIATVVLVIPRLGMALTFSLIVAGQIALSIIFDHFGLLGNPVREISFGRFVGVLFLVAAIVLIRKY